MSSAELTPQSASTAAVLPRERVEFVRSAADGASAAPAPAPMTRSAAPGGRDTTNVAIPATDEFDVVTVFWGSNRKISLTPGKPAPKQQSMIETGSVQSFPQLGAENARKLSVGVAQVTVPKEGRKIGAVNRPTQYTVLGVSFYSEKENPKKHFTIGRLDVLSPASFASAVDGRAERSRRFMDQAFVFVHGFNVSFEDALYRTAQISYDLEFDGVPMLYSWPSHKASSSLQLAQAYVHDIDMSDSAPEYFVEFLELVAKKTRVKQINIIAHSMGNRALMEALRRIANNPERLAKLDIKQVIFAAPDVEQSRFEEIAKQIRQTAQGITLYASSSDKALMASKEAHLGLVRAGDVPASGPLITPGVDTIDVTAAGANSFWSLDHSVFAEKSHIITDIKLLMETGVRPPDQRFGVFKPKTVAAGTYWRYVPN